MGMQFLNRSIVYLTCLAFLVQPTPAPWGGGFTFKVFPRSAFEKPKTPKRLFPYIVLPVTSWKENTYCWSGCGTEVTGFLAGRRKSHCRFCLHKICRDAKCRFTHSMPTPHKAYNYKCCKSCHETISKIKKRGRDKEFGKAAWQRHLADMKSREARGEAAANPLALTPQAGKMAELYDKL